MRAEILVISVLMIGVLVSSGCTSGVYNCKSNSECFSKYLKTCEPAMSEVPTSSGDTCFIITGEVEDGMCEITKITKFYSRSIKITQRCLADPNQEMNKIVAVPKVNNCTEILRERF